MENHENNPHETGGADDDRTTRPIPQPHGGALLPFVPGDPRAAKGRDRALQVRREHRVLREQKETDLRKLMAGYVDMFPRADLGKNAAAVANVLLARIVDGDIPVRHAGDAAELLRVLVEVVRLESGDATSHVLHATMDPEAALARLRELRDRAARGSIVEHTSEQGPD